MKSGIKKDKGTHEKALFWSSIEESVCQRRNGPAGKEDFCHRPRVLLVRQVRRKDLAILEVRLHDPEKKGTDADTIISKRYTTRSFDFRLA